MRLLFEAVIATTFGKGHKTRALRIGLTRIGICYVTALCIGGLFAVSLPDLPFASNAWAFLVSGMFILHVALLLTFMSTLHLTHASKQDQFMRILHTLPVPPHIQWMVRFMPVFIMASLVVCFLGPSIAMLVIDSGVPALLLLPALSIGVVGAFGLMYALPMRSRGVWWIVRFAVLLLEYVALHYVHSASLPIGWRQSLCILLFLLWTVLGILFLQSRTQIVQLDPSTATHVPILRFVPIHLWFIKKLARSLVGKIGLMVTLLLCAFIGLLSYYFHLVDPETMGSIIAVLIAAYTSDIRSLTMRRNPPEIANIRGTGYFARYQMLTAALSSILAISPLLLILFLSGAIALDSSLYSFCAQLLLGVCSGLFAGTLIVPTARDVSAQCLATLLALSMVMLPYMAIPRSITPSILTAASTLLAIGLFVASLAIEYKRNTFNWRRTA